jgi:Enoyl-(Acyl carrier protein) reductase
MGFLADKRFLITGMISTRSIAYGIAQAMHREGAELAFTYQGERVRDRVLDLVKEFDSKLIFQCDVASDDDINQLFADLNKHWDGLDGFVHAIGFAPREALDGEFLDGFSREAFRIAHDGGPQGISVDSDLSGCSPHDAALQRDGLGQGQSGSQRALSGDATGAPGNSRQRYFRGTDQDSGRIRHRRFQQTAELQREACAAQT